MNRPAVLLADEPTGNLDSRTSATVLEILGRLNREQGLTIVLVTHDSRVASIALRQLQFEDGRLVVDVHQTNRASAEVLR